MEEAQRELLTKQEEDARWAEIAQEVPGGLFAANSPAERRALEIEHPALLEDLDATAGMMLAGRELRAEPSAEESDGAELEGVGDDVANPASAAEDEKVLSSLSQENADEQYNYDDVFQPYERDRPLSDEEVAQAPLPADGQVVDDASGEENGNGSRHEKDR